MYAKELHSAELPWVETLDICSVPLELENVHDDLKREGTQGVFELNVLKPF